MGTVSVVGRWPMKGDPAAHIHDADCEGRRLWFDTPDEVLEISAFGDFPCWCVEREIGWVSRETAALAHYDERWRLAGDSVRVAWEVRARELVARKGALCACLAESA